jgi:hypothetical protein
MTAGCARDVRARIAIVEHPRMTADALTRQSSQDDDASRARIPAGSEILQDPPIPKRKLGKGGGSRRKGAAVQACVCEEQQNMMVIAISTFEAHLAFQRLDVADHGLGFDWESPVTSPDHRVPGSKISRVANRNLGRPPEGGIQPRFQPLEEAGMPNIADGVARWIDANREIESKDLANRRQVRELEIGFAALESPKPRKVDARCSRDVSQAETSASSRGPDFPRHSIHAFPRPTAAPIGRPFPRSHAESFWRRPIHRQLPVQVVTTSLWAIDTLNVKQQRAPNVAVRPLRRAFAEPVLCSRQQTPSQGRRADPQARFVSPLWCAGQRASAGWRPRLPRGAQHA